jgi:hypothetical protein
MPLFKFLLRQELPNQANVLTAQNNKIRLIIGMVRTEEEYTKSTKLKVHKLTVPL